MRTCVASLLAFLLVVCGAIIIGMAGVRLAQESGFLRKDLDTPGATALDDRLPVAQTTQPQTSQQPLLAGVESGGMALGGSAQPAAVQAVAGGGSIMDGPVEPTLASTPEATVDACAPQPEPGFAAESPVVAIGMIRLYTDTDVLAATLGEFGAGQSFTVTADGAGVTAIRRCELVWVRVRLAGGQQGWVLAHAVEIALPTVMPTSMPTMVAPICPGGCATPTCVEPCYNPCAQPCADPCYSPCIQPCTTPCGVYTQ